MVVKTKQMRLIQYELTLMRREVDYLKGLMDGIGRATPFGYRLDCSRSDCTVRDDNEAKGCP